jgi:hypothetical protein
MTNWKGFGRKLSWLNFKVLSQHSPGGTYENHAKPKSWLPVSRARFEPKTYQIQSRSSFFHHQQRVQCARIKTCTKDANLPNVFNTKHCPVHKTPSDISQLLSDLSKVLNLEKSTVLCYTHCVNYTCHPFDRLTDWLIMSMGLDISEPWLPKDYCSFCRWYVSVERHGGDDNAGWRKLLTRPPELSGNPTSRGSWSE